MKEEITQLKREKYYAPIRQFDDTVITTIELLYTQLEKAEDEIDALNTRIERLEQIITNRT